MDTNRIFFEAIALRKCVQATYNRTVAMLAPHILYTRHDELYLDAVTVEREGQPPRELKLGTFKLAGLKDVLITNTPFDRMPLYDPKDPKYEGVTVFAVDPG
ncbi:hypothetical protein BH11PSE5_BH11PSE5_21590 [soil metagenome]|jgi:hypothetical protein|uniref:hypothetical protein n=1 Tax=unclassified Sphingobium TaxID=2611147 RepID=UPI001E4AF984|nr:MULTISPECIES: hypothetical protein [unclassified Sphingobium]GLI97018.1 hypothetical protein Sbs19_08360 [Sphingobium sp. BS19]CAH0349195.1 hypothetical protein SPH9361_00483 [Sphingobium sp. CECT 9361]|tara:strand:- start:56 stop:361 length:306 start_codon:yes stop_codon:yes gene_type:complete